MVLFVLLFYVSSYFLSHFLSSACCITRPKWTETPVDKINMYRHGCVILIENKIQIQYKLFDILETTSTGATFKGSWFDYHKRTLQ